MSSSKHKKHSHEGKDHTSTAGTPKKLFEADAMAKSKTGSTKSGSMDVDSNAPPAPSPTPSKRKSSDTHGKSKAELLLEKSPTLLKTLRDKHRASSPSPVADHSSREHSRTLSKSPSSVKMAPVESDSDDDDEAFQKLRAQGALELEQSKSASKAAKPAPMSDSDSDDDAPVAKSFKDIKQDAMEAHQHEQQDVRAALQTQKEKRRQRTQLLQEQSKKTQHKKKEKEKRKKEQEAEMDVDSEEENLLPASLLKQAMNHTVSTEKVVELEDKDAKLREKKREWRAAQQRDLEDKIESKRVTVVPLSDGSGNVQMQSRKAAAQSAEAFLKEHFWGGRLERMPAEHYLSERIRGPALQFIVPNHVQQQQGPSRSMKSHRKTVQMRRNKP